MNNIIEPQTLFKMYKNGFFPMAENSFDKDINFYKPRKRFLIPIKKFHLPKRLFKEYKKKKFDFKINSNFKNVIVNCSLRKNNQNTWINDLIINSYINLNNLGYAHSVECLYKNELVGGLYGVHLGECFFGESMFSKQNNASKFSLLYLISILIKNNFKLLDSQFYNKHLVQFGAYEIDSILYDKLLKKHLKKKFIFKNNIDYLESVSILQSLIQRS